MRTKLMMLVLVAALAVTFVPSAVGQYPIVENPSVQAQKDAAQAKADAAAAKAKTDDLQKQFDALKKSGPASDSNWMWWLLLLIPAGFAGWWFFLRNRGEGQPPVVPAPDPNPEPAPNPNPNPEPAPNPNPNPEPAPNPNPNPEPGNLTEGDKGKLKQVIAGIAVLLFVASGVASAAVPCAVSNSFGSSKNPIAVVNIDNVIKCQATGALTVFDSRNNAVATGTKVINFKPTSVGRYTIKSGRVTISELGVVEKNEAGLLDFGSYLSSRNQSTTDATARTQAQQANVRANAALTTANNAGQAVVSLDGQLKAIANRTDQLEQRISTLESRPATQVDLTPLERRVATLEAELARVKATANTALTTAQGADAKATDALTRYEEMGLARFKTGWFRSRTVVEAVEVSKAQAEKDAEEARVKAEKAAAKAAKKNQK